MFRATPTAGVEQKTPTLIPGIAKDAVSAATAMSHIETSWQPAAVAMPWTRAMTGCGSFVKETIIRLQSSKRRRCQASSPACARISFRSWPAQKPRPSAARTTTRAEGSMAMASISSWIAAIISRERGLNRSGRFSTRRTTPPSLRDTTSGRDAVGEAAGLSMLISRLLPPRDSERSFRNSQGDGK